MKRNELDKIALTYANSTDPTFTIDEKMLQILAERTLPLVKGPNVLEMGVGECAWTGEVIKRFGRSSVVDGSAVLLALVKEKYGSNVLTHHSFFETFNPGVKYDTILATMILEHVDDPPLVMRQMKHYSKKDTQIIIMVPNANSIHRLYGTALGFLREPKQLNEGDLNLGHRRVYTASEMEDHIRKAGLKVVKRWATYIKFLSNAQMKDFTDAQLRGLFALAEKIDVNYSAHLFYECKFN